MAEVVEPDALHNDLATLLTSLCKAMSLDGFAGTVTVTGGGLRGDTLEPLQFSWPIVVKHGEPEGNTGPGAALAQRQVTPSDEVVAANMKQVAERQQKALRGKKKIFMEPQFHRQERMRNG